MATAKWTTPGDVLTWLSTDLNSLANTAGEVPGGASPVAIVSDGMLYGDFVLDVTFGTNPTANSLVEMYFIVKIDGTNWEDYTRGASAVGPANGYAGAFPVAATTSLQQIACRRVELPSSDFLVMLINKTGQAFAASGNTLKVRKYSEQAA